MLKLKSTSTVHRYLNNLEKKGYLSRDASRPRAISVINNGDSLSGFGILYKDYVVIGKSTMVNNDDLTLVLLHNEFPAIKQYSRDGDDIILKSSNNIVLDSSLVKVLGKVKIVFRTIL